MGNFKKGDTVRMSRGTQPMLVLEARLVETEVEKRKLAYKRDLPDFGWYYRVEYCRKMVKDPEAKWTRGHWQFENRLEKFDGSLPRP